MKNFSEIIVTIVTGICICTAIFFIGTAIHKAIEAPSECAGSVIRLDKMDSTRSCDDGAVAEKPEKVKVDGDDVMVVRCTCKDKPVGIDTEPSIDDNESVSEEVGEVKEKSDDFL